MQRPEALLDFIARRINALICVLSLARETLLWTPVIGRFPLIQYWHWESNGRARVDYFSLLCQSCSSVQTQLKSIETSGADGWAREVRAWGHVKMTLQSLREKQFCKITYLLKSYCALRKLRHSNWSVAIYLSACAVFKQV